MSKRLWFTVLAIAIFAAASTAGRQRGDTPAGASGPVAPTGQTDPGPSVTTDPALQTKTLFAVGDIMDCTAPERAEAVGNLLKQHLDESPDSIALTLGDNSQNFGTREDYDCLDRSVWSGLRPWLYPVAGNHDYLEYRENGTVPYMYLWFLNTGAVEDGYYAFDLGKDWRVVAINSELMGRVNGNLTKRALDMLTWLDAEVHHYASSKCIVAYMHRPMFSSGQFPGTAYVDQVYDILYRYGVDLLLTGHEHFFAEFPPLNPRGVEDPKGVPTLIVGTGGGRLFAPPLRNRYHESILANTLGILRLELGAGTYQWKFLPVDAMAPSPEGMGTCHENPPGY